MGIMEKIEHEFNCEECGETVKLVHEVESPQESVINNSSSLPLPKTAQILKSFGITKYIDHHNHTIAVELKPTGEIKRITTIPKLQTLTDTLVQSIVNLTRILNGYLFGSTSKIKPSILFLSKSTQISNFLAAQASINLISDDKIALKRTDDNVQVEFDRIGFILTNLELGLKMLQKKIKVSSIIDQTDLVIKSIVIDCADIDQQFILKDIQAKKLSIEKDNRIILAYNTRLNKTPPNQVKDYFETEYGVANINLMNYDTFEGLKAVNLQSYYNLVENEYAIRELHEKYLKENNL